MPRTKRKVVAVCGSSSFPLSVPVGAAVLDLLLAYPQGTLFLTRGSPGFDTFLLDACPQLGLAIELRPSQGGPSNFARDAAMAVECSELLAFLDPKTLHREDTGTAHMVEKFLDKRRRVQSYSAAGDALVFVGSSE